MLLFTSTRYKITYSDFSSIAAVGDKIDSLILLTPHDNGLLTNVFTAQDDQLLLFCDVICSKFDRDFMVPSLKKKKKWQHVKSIFKIF